MTPEDVSAEATWQHMIAAKYSAVLGQHVIPLRMVEPDGYEGWRVKTSHGVHAEIWATLFTWRLALVAADDYHQASVPFWCYPRTGAGLTLAMMNAVLWEGPDTWQPQGFTRAWDRDRP